MKELPKTERPYEKLEQYGEKTLTNLTFDSGNINIDLFDIAEYLSVEFKTEVTIYIDTGNTGFDVPSAFKAIQKGSISAGANYFYIGDDGKLAQNSIISGSEFEADFDTKNYLLKILWNLTQDGLNHQALFKLK